MYYYRKALRQLRSCITQERTLQLVTYEILKDAFTNVYKELLLTKPELCVLDIKPMKFGVKVILFHQELFDEVGYIQIEQTKKDRTILYGISVLGVDFNRNRNHKLIISQL